MKGYYIEVTNNLLDPKHREAMGNSVWLFMWLLDKMTSINEEGVGKVLGGKPIKFNEVKDDLGISRRTYVEWVDLLLKGGYINTTQAPYGLIISVNKAKKRFSRDVQKTAHPDVQKKERDVQESVERSAGNDASNIRQDKDNTIDTSEVPSQGKEINELIDLFKEVNPSISKYFKNKTQRSAVERMLKAYGRSKLEGMIKALPIVNSRPYWPKSTTPIELENNLGKYKALNESDKNKGQSKIKVAIIN